MENQTEQQQIDNEEKENSKNLAFEMREIVNRAWQEKFDKYVEQFTRKIKSTAEAGGTYAETSHFVKMYELDLFCKHFCELGFEVEDVIIREGDKDTHCIRVSW